MCSTCMYVSAFHESGLLKQNAGEPSTNMMISKRYGMAAVHCQGGPEHRDN